MSQESVPTDAYSTHAYVDEPTVDPYIPSVYVSFTFVAEMNYVEDSFVRITSVPSLKSCDTICILGGGGSIASYSKLQKEALRDCLRQACYYWS